MDKKALQELVKEVDPTEQLDEDVEDVHINCLFNYSFKILKSKILFFKDAFASSRRLH